MGVAVGTVGVVVAVGGVPVLVDVAVWVGVPADGVKVAVGRVAVGVWGVNVFVWDGVPTVAVKVRVAGGGEVKVGSGVRVLVGKRGVTLGTYNQSPEMIRSDMRQLANFKSGTLTP